MTFSTSPNHPNSSKQNSNFMHHWSISIPVVLIAFDSHYFSAGGGKKHQLEHSSANTTQNLGNSESDNWIPRMNLRNTLSPCTLSNRFEVRSEAVDIGPFPVVVECVGQRGWELTAARTRVSVFMDYANILIFFSFVEFLYDRFNASLVPFS